MTKLLMNKYVPFVGLKYYIIFSQSPATQLRFGI